MQPPHTGLVTADGSTLTGLCGIAAVQICFAGSTRTHDITVQVIDRKHLSPLIGMEFWKSHKAMFDLNSNTITIESVEEDGSTVVEVIQCGCERDEPHHTAIAAVQDQIAALQQAQRWAQQETLINEVRPAPKQTTQQASTTHNRMMSTRQCTACKRRSMKQRCTG